MMSLVSMCVHKKEAGNIGLGQVIKDLMCLNEELGRYLLGNGELMERFIWGSAMFMGFRKGLSNSSLEEL